MDECGCGPLRDGAGRRRRRVVCVGGWWWWAVTFGGAPLNVVHREPTAVVREIEPVPAAPT